MLGPGDQIVVFASNKNFTAPGGEHHTNFRLDPDGEFLALVQPDGTTVASQFAPSYPPQFEDISYGISQQVIEHDLVNTGDTAAVLVHYGGNDFEATILSGTAAVQMTAKKRGEELTRELADARGKILASTQVATADASTESQ